MTQFAKGKKKVVESLRSTCPLVLIKIETELTHTLVHPTLFMLTSSLQKDDATGGKTAVLQLRGNG